MSDTLLALLATRPTTIAYLGNSVTAQRDGYRPRLHALIEARTGHTHRAVNAGFGGVGAIVSLCTMNTMVTTHRPGLCFVECLTGDIGVGPHRYSGAAIEGIIAKLMSIGAVPVLVLLPRTGGHAADAPLLAELYRRIAAQHGVALIDLIDHWSDPRSLLRDGVHTNDLGKAAFADAILAALARPRPDPTGKERLFAPDLASADAPPAGRFITGRSADGLFRLQMRYWTIGADKTFRLVLPDEALLGLLLIQGPHSGTITVNGARHDLRDRWCHYERLHGHVFPKPFGAGEPISIDAITGALRLTALLTYR